MTVGPVMAAELVAGDVICTPNPPACPVAGCVNARGRRRSTSEYAAMCWAHMTRKARHGDIDPTRPVKIRTGAPSHHGNGYLAVHIPGHPLADKSGRVFAHRKVLFDAIGPGAHPCHRCGKSVVWSDPFPHGLVVDHRDHDRANNDPANLAPSCHPCNVSRSKTAIDGHCANGHPRNDANTHLDKQGKRRCRQCQRARSRRYYASKKATS